jgi:hypothetical protein
MKQEALIGTTAPFDALTVSAIGILAYMLGTSCTKGWDLAALVSWSAASLS